MADRSSLKMIGFVIAGLAVAVILIAGLLVHKTVAGKLALDQQRQPAVTVSLPAAAR